MVSHVDEVNNERGHPSNNCGHWLQPTIRYEWSPLHPPTPSRPSLPSSAPHYDHPTGHQDGNSFDTRVSSLVALNDGRQTLNLTGTNDSQVLR